MSEVAKKQIFSLHGKEFYYWTLGEKSNPWVLLIPGFTSTHSDLLPLGRVLREKYFVVIPDLPGWGKSPKLTSILTIENYTRFLHKLVNSLQVREISLVGYCFGAVVGLAYVLEFPEKIVTNIFINTPYLEGVPFNKIPFYFAEISQHIPKILRPLFFLWRNRLSAAPFAFFHFHTRSLKRKLQYMLHSVRIQSTQNEQAVEQNWTSLAEFSFQKLQKISTPIHLIHSENDVLVPLAQAEKLLALFHHATLDIIPNAGHWVPAEKPHALGSLILKYLPLSSI